MLNQVTIEVGKRNGKPCIRGLRITVSDILGYLKAGMSFEEILEDFPQLTKNDILAAVSWKTNPKQKAAELVNKNKMILMQEDTDCGNEILCSIIAIKNSHIAVDEILELMIKLSIDEQVKWWRKVKDELQDL